MYIYSKLSEKNRGEVMEAVNLVEVFRGKMVESIHKGHVAVVDYTGKLLYYSGNPSQKVYARSSMKPIQAIPLVESGAADQFQFEDADISLCCASHNGEPQHTDRVVSILKKIGLNDNSLKCGTHIPRWQDTYKDLIRQGKDVTPIYNNCSGKHSGMLSTAVFMNEPTENYFEIEHPVQQRIIQTISQLSDYPVEEIEIGIDGCGVPVHGLPLERFAYMYARMTRPELLGEKRGDTVKRITSAMTNAPEMVGGTDRFCTDFMREAGGRLFGKAGAEAVYCIGDNQTGIGIAIKIEDGNGRAMYPVAVEVLKQLNLLEESQIHNLEDYYRTKVKNARNEVIGELVPSFQLQDATELIRR